MSYIHKNVLNVRGDLRALGAAVARHYDFRRLLEVHSDAAILSNAVRHLTRIYPDREYALEEHRNFVERKVTVLEGCLEDNVGTAGVDLYAPESGSFVGSFGKPVVGV